MSPVAGGSGQGWLDGAVAAWARAEFPRRLGWRRYAGTLVIVALCTALAASMQRHFDLSNLTMVYLGGVVVSAVAFGRGPAFLAALLGVAVFDFGFVPPRFTLRVTDTQYLVTFGVMLLVATVIGTLTAWLREQLDEARVRERRAAALYALSRDLAARSTTSGVLEAAVSHISGVIEAELVVLLPDRDGALRPAAGDLTLFAGDGDELRTAAWAAENGQMAGLDAESRLTGRGLHLPLSGATRVLGVVSVRPPHPLFFQDAERLRLLRSSAYQTALALERCRLAEDAQHARTQAEIERARSALLSSVSHDLRTPLAAITGAASSLRDDPGTMGEATRRELADTISEEAQRLNRLIANLLDMTRLESGTLRVRKEWHSLEEVVGAALARLEPVLGDRPVELALPEDPRLVPLDDVLFELVLANLIENADRYSPAGRPLEVRAALESDAVRIEVADRGPGLAPGEETRVFEKFFRGAAAAGRHGAGLGLAICRGIVEAHGGRIEAANRAGGGAVFTVRLPLGGQPPAVEAEAPEPVAPGETA